MVGNMHDIYTGYGPLRPSKAAHYLAGYSWLIDNFAQHYDMPNTQLYPQSENEFENSAPPTQEPSSAKWIDDQFTALRTFAKLTHIPMSFKLLPDDLPQPSESNAQQYSLTEKYATLADEKYYVEDHGIPVIYYQKDLQDKPGYIQKRIVTRLADMLHKTARKPKLVRDIPNKDLTILCGSFMGLGHVFCAGLTTSKQAVRSSGNDNISAFALAIFFHLKGLSQEQAVEQYGQYLSEQTQYDLKLAYEQIRMNRYQIKALHEKLDLLKNEKAA